MCSTGLIIIFFLVFIRGENNFPSAHNLMYGTEDKVSETAIDRMVDDIEKQ